MMNRDQLLQELIVIFDKGLQNGLAEAVKLTLGKLFHLAQNADSNQKEQVFFNQYRELKEQEKRLRQEVREQTKRMPDFISSEVNKSDKKMSLALVEDEELSISLSLTQLDSTLEIAGHTELYLLEKRMNVLFGDERIDKTNMPFSPAAIVWLMSHALKSMNWSESVKTKLIEALQKSLHRSISELYHQLNERLIASGILPNLQPEYKAPQSRQSEIEKKPEKATQSEQDKPDDEPVETPTTPKQDQTNKGMASSGDEQQLINSIFKLLSKQQSQGQSYQSNYETDVPRSNRLSQASPPNDGQVGGRQHEVSGNDFDQALSQIEQDAGILANSRNLSDLKSLLTDRVRNNTGNYYPELSERQHKTIDLMGMIYDEIHEDNRIDKDIRSSLNAINVPLIKTAVKDDTFFSDQDHPARQFMELLLQTSQRWYGTDVIKQVHQFSDHAAKDFDGSREGFVKALNSLSEFLSVTENRAIKAEQKWVSAAQGKEKMQLTKEKVNQELDAILKDCEVKFVRDVVKQVSMDALTLTMLREGQDSEQWQANINTAKVLSQIGNRKKFKQLTGPQKLAAMRHLDETMDELGFSKRDRMTTKDNLHACFMWQEANQDQEQTEPPKLKKVQSVDKASKEHKQESDSDKKIEEIRSLNDREKQLVDHIIHVPYGTLFDFKANQSGDIVRRKLSWVSTLSERVLLVDLAGRHPHKMGLARMAIDMSRNNIIQVELDSGGYIKKALGRIMNRLKKMAA
ncbi:DUF1631 family protein [Marinicella gelatinilytica]|uniref:DUF1631 family protein n=1 Tax=Marinicella gelatinilytica TaxID=2996017 RepID=UPI002260F861|nr:DUF1631 family protein [Marinicella gelatinilytica]MCX7544215.1 DUF1631 family protein [Marinicella gelatinilytica]